MSRGKRHSLEKKEAVRAMCECNVPVKEISLKTGVCENTIYDWINNDFKNDDKFQKLRDENKDKIISRAWKGVETALDIILLKLARGKKIEAELNTILERLQSDELLDELEAEKLTTKIKMLVPESLGDVGRVFGVMIDKINVMTGKPTQNVNITGLKFEDM